jgi:hypothetical protein
MFPDREGGQIRFLDETEGLGVVRVVSIRHGRFPNLKALI